MRSCLALVCCASCTADPSTASLVIEHQPAALVATSADAWMVGSAIVVQSDPTLPQPLALRVSMRDAAQQRVALLPAGTAPKPYGGAHLRWSPAAEGTGCNYPLPDEPPIDCSYELEIFEAGASVVAVTGDSAAGAATECFYYAVVDPTVDVDTLRDELERLARTCRDSYDE